MAVRIVTDSTSDLPRDLAASWDIGVVPLTVNFGDESYRDGIDLDAASFIQKLASSPVLPHTAQPSPAAFAEVYKELLLQGRQVCSIHISAKLSGTQQSALLARQDSGQEGDIAVVDSGWTSMGLGLIVLHAAKAAREGASLPELVRLVEELRGKIDLLLFCDTLEYLQRGGRIGRAAAFLGGLLKVKPIITLKDGEVAPVERVRTRSRALEHVWEWARGLPQLREFCILYSGDSQDAREFHRKVREHFPQAQDYLVPVGPVIATHVGPGAVGIVVLP